MEKKTISLIAGLLFCVLSFGQLIGTGNNSWAKAMCASYCALNNHNTYSQAQQDSICARLQEPYVYYTFRDKLVCDFFLFFENLNDSTNLTARTITKTGATLRWNYGGGNVYSQNNLPAQINNGVITVTSTDGFCAITVWNLTSNSFTGYLPNIQYYFPIATTLDFSNNDFYGKYPLFDNIMEQTNVSFYGNKIVDTFPDLSKLCKIQRWQDYRQVGTTDLHDTSVFLGGSISQFNSPELIVINSYDNNIDELRITNFSKVMTTFNVEGSWLPTSEINQLFADMKTYYTANAPTANLTVDVGAGLQNWNGTLTGGAANADLVALQGIYTTAGKTFTAVYNTATPYNNDSSYFSFTWDDAAISVHDTALPIFEEYGLTSTVYITAGPNHIDHMLAYGEMGMGWDRITNLHNEGWTCGAHGYLHIALGTATAAQIHDELYKNDSAFLSHSLPAPDHHAYPQGSYSNQSVDSCKLYYSTSRVVYDSPVFRDSLRLGMFDAEGLDDNEMRILKRKIDTCVSRKQSLILLAHRCHTAYSGDYNDRYTLLTSQLRELIEYIESKPKTRIVNAKELYRVLW